MVYLQLLEALILAIFVMVSGGSHMILGVHHWHPFVISCLYPVKWLWQKTSGWKSTCFCLIWCRQGMHCVGSMSGTMIHSLVVIWKHSFIVFCFHVLLIFLCSWGDLFGECDMSWRCPLGVWFSLLCMMHVPGGAMGSPWLPNYIFLLDVGGALWRTWVFGGGTSWFICLMG